MSHQPPPYQTPPTPTSEMASTPGMSSSCLGTPSAERILRSARVDLEELPPPDRRRKKKKKKTTLPSPTLEEPPMEPLFWRLCKEWPYVYLRGLESTIPYKSFSPTLDDVPRYTFPNGTVGFKQMLPPKLDGYLIERPKTAPPAPQPTPPSPQPPAPQPTPPPPPTPLPPKTPVSEPSTNTASWANVIRRRRSNSQSSNSSVGSTSKLITSVTVSGLPREAATPKALELLCRKIPGLLIANLKVFANGVATFSSPQADLRERIAALSHHVGQPLTIASDHRSPAPRRAAAEKAPTFSCVLRGVQLDIDAEDVKTGLSAASLEFVNTWRIIAKATDKPTLMFRITTKSQSTIDHLLTKGLRMFHFTYYAEPSHPPKPTPIQCRKCQKFDHPSDACQQRRAVCGICGASHPTSTCRATTTPKCSNCNGDHVAFSPRCPERPVEAASPATAAPLKTVDAPPPEVLAHSEDPSLHAIIRFLMSSLSNLFPNLRDRIGRVLKPLIYHFFGLQFAASYSGNFLHVSLV